MPVTIRDINIKSLHPIPKPFKWELGKLNLIYGKNETGKTYLVEFLIQSLFKTKGWQLRGQTGTGRIMVDGLERESISFSPQSKKKFEDYYTGMVSGLPPDFSKLIVIKGADVELEKNGADKTFIKRYLSSKETLDDIEEDISKTLQAASIDDDCEINASRIGEIKTRNELEQRLNNIDNLFNEVNKFYLGGERQTLENRKAMLEQDLGEMDKAKRHYAFKLFKQKQELDQKKNRVEDSLLDDITSSLATYRGKETEFETKHKNYDKAAEESKDYPWLDKASKQYNDYLSQVSTFKPNILHFIPIIALIALAGIFSFFDIFIGVLASLIALIINIFLVIRGYQNVVKADSRGSEIRKIEEEYKKRFENSLSGLAELDAKRDEQREIHAKSVLLKDQLKDTDSELNQLRAQLIRDFRQIYENKIDPKKWEDSLKDIKTEKRQLQEKIQQINSKILPLNIREEDYLEEKPSIEYDKKKYEQIDTDLHQVSEQVNILENSLNNLKSLISQITKDDASISWEILIQHLRDKHKETLDDFKNITAEIVGKIAVMEIINKLREQEDDKIKQNLEDDIICRPLKEVTNRYTGFRLDGETLFVQDPFNEFKLGDISTGAREQVLLALRMGFCSRLLKKDSCFLILDDAFQYSDWDRRKLLTDKVVDLAKKGWQIIYFTMDDNIKELFNTKGKALGTDYKNFVLAES